MCEASNKWLKVTRFIIAYRDRKASSSSVSQLPAALTLAVFELTWGKLGLWRHSEIFLERMLVGKGVSVEILDFSFTYLPAFPLAY